VKRANGEGNIREIKEKNLWQGRIMIDGHSYTRYGKTKDEVRRKIMIIRTTADAGNLPAPNKLSVEEWMLAWLDTYCQVKESTMVKYRSVMRNHIVPAMGDVQLQKLTTYRVQRFYNQKRAEGKSAKTIKDIHGVLHKALAKAVQLRYVQHNACEGCELPKLIEKEMRPIQDDEVKQFLHAIKGMRYEQLMYVALFTGMRQGELLGLTWDCIDFKRGAIRVYRQLCPIKEKGAAYKFESLKNRTARIIVPAGDVMECFRAIQDQQRELQKKAGELWDNPEGLVFTNETGGHLCHYTVYKHFKKVVKGMGLPEIRFHDLRHSFAVLALETGMDMKTTSVMMGHATTAFTTQKYGHVSDKMRRECAQKMQQYIDNLK